MKFSFRNIILTLSILFVAGCQSTDKFNYSAADTPMTFERGGVFIGDNVAERYRIDYDAIRAGADKHQGKEWSAAYTLAKLDELDAKLGPGETVPLIVYMHGCAGIVIPSLRHVDALTKLGDYIVASPNSFARPRPVSCRSAGDTDFQVMQDSRSWRRAELAYAMNELLTHSWVDRNNIFLIGHSQGGTTVLDYSGPARIKGRVTMHGGCSVGSLTILEDNTRPDEQILGFHSGEDPWYQNYQSGCPHVVKRHPNGTLIYESDDNTHDLVAKKKYWEILAAWIRKHTDR
ncbi:MAG: hypothetical protein CMM59_03575 [Rhodospirillaceae bacterium]|nr:hypothetical protein [Rhodospirillaceae bacterium]|tara:strand:+ start:1948 stop:2814 length:867 start_codon:yes stop_codon:yes gene_type:complete